MKRALIVLLLTAGLSLSLLANPTLADSPMVGEIRLWSGTSVYPPAGWLFCDGSTLNNADYPDLFGVISQTYGGVNDQFKLPDLRGRVPVGRDTTKTEFDGWGETGGEISHTLTIAEIPSHRHYLGNAWQNGETTSLYFNPSGAGANMTYYGYTNYTGGGQAHNNLPPYLTLRFIIYTGVGGPTPTPTATPLATYTPAPTYTPVPTYTPQPTYTPGPTAIYAPMVITHTLRSSNTLSIPEQVSFGQIITSGIVISLLAVFALDFIFRLVYRR